MSNELYISRVYIDLSIFISDIKRHMNEAIWVSNADPNPTIPECNLSLLTNAPSKTVYVLLNHVIRHSKKRIFLPLYVLSFRFVV